MAHPNRRGDVLAGTWGPVSITNVPLSATHAGSRLADAGAVGWLDDVDTAVLVARLDPPTAGTDPQGLCIALYDQRTQTVTPVAPRGANAGAAGGGVWAVSSSRDGLLASTGWADPGLFVHDVGPDGAIAYTDFRNFPVRLRYPNGHDVELYAGVVHSLTLLGDGRAVFGTHDGRWHFVGVPQPVGLPQGANLVRLAEVAGTWWLTYQLGYQVVLRRADDPTRGYVYPFVQRPDAGAFGLQLRDVDGQALVCWSVFAGARPGEQEVRVQDLGAPMVALLEAPVPVPVPAVRPWPRKLWIAPFKTHSHRYGDTPIEDHVGNAVYVEGDDREHPGRIHAELDRVRRLGQPMIVAVEEPIDAVHINTTIAWFVHAADLPTLEQKVEVALGWPEKPVIAYLDKMRAEDWPLQRPAWMSARVWPSVMAYRDPGEPLATFDLRVTAMLHRVAQWGTSLALTPAFFTRNGRATVAEIVECMPLYERWIREFPIVCVMPFADRRPTGMIDHPVLRAWARAFLEANPARPNRFDYWRGGATDLPTVLRNKLGQSTELVILSADEKRYLLDRLGT
ncbi:MAG TPA: hypothetical protein VM364_00505 [Vicinamibacterales bacterium]|nr:hypothetical protein [Vicinamibacterales bacterium]